MLAAGKGIRMLPYTNERPKVLIEIAGKPFLHYVLKNLEKAGINNIGIVVGYKKEKIYDFVREYGFNVSFIEQKQQLGTGHAVLCAKNWVGDENFIVLMGDNLYSENDILTLSKLEDNYIYVSAFRSDHPEDYGVIEMKDHSLIKIQEKPSHPKSNLVNVGLYKLTSKIFNTLVRIKKSPRGELELTDAINDLASYGEVKVYELKNYWLDMSVKEDLLKVEEKIKELGL